VQDSGMRGGLRGRWQVAEGGGRGAEGSVVLRPTDPLDNAATGGSLTFLTREIRVDTTPSMLPRFSRFQVEDSSPVTGRGEFLDLRAASAASARSIDR